MNETTTIRFIGLDVHRDSIAIAVAIRDGKPAESLGSVPNDVPGLIRRLSRLGPAESLWCCYEAGPTGFGLARRLNDVGIACEVIAPSLIPVQPGARVKTDRRDAQKLAQYLRSGDLTPVHVLDPATEAIRDLERARDDAKRAERAARHQLSKFLLRHGRWFEGRSTWGPAHLAWLAKQQFDNKAQQDVMNDYREAVEMATARVSRLTERLVERVAAWDKASLVTALQALRGVDLISAATLVAEVGDFRRFRSASELMSFVGRREPPSGPDHAHRQRPRAPDPGGVGVALPEAATNEQGDPRAKRPGVGAGSGDRLEGAASASQAVVPSDGTRQASDSGGDSGGAGVGGVRLGDCPGGGAAGGMSRGEAERRVVECPSSRDQDRRDGRPGRDVCTDRGNPRRTLGPAPLVARTPAL